MKQIRERKNDFKIWKYELGIVGEQTVYIPEKAELLSVANQGGNLCLWAMVDASQQHDRARNIRIIGTGHPIDEKHRLKFISTVVIDPFVWHVFEFV